MNKSASDYYLEFIDLKRTSRIVVVIALIASSALSATSAVLGYLGVFYPFLALSVASGLMLIAHLRGLHRLAAIGISAVAPVFTTLLIIDGNGLNDPGILAYAITVIFSSFLLGRRSVLFFTPLNGALAGFVYWLENRGYLFGWQNDNIQVASPFDLLIVEALLLISSYLVWVVIGYVEKNIAAVLRSEAEIRAAVEERTRELAAAQQELLNQERLATLGQLTATVAHELRNPLGTVRNAVFAIGDATERNMPGRITELRELANRNIVRCDGIIDELLDYTRYRELYLEPTAIGEWIGEILQQQSFPEPIDWTRDLVSGLTVQVDQEAFRRAIVNILQNAVDSVSSERQARDTEVPGRITVRARVVADRLEVSVSDNGPGMESEAVQRIFEPFYSTKTNGVGLGMPVVRNIMERHGGGVDVESEPLSGTTVTLWMPVNGDDERGANDGEH